MEPLDERARFPFGWAFGIIWLVLLVNPLHKAWAQHDSSKRFAGVAALAVFAGVFVAALVRGRQRRLTGRPTGYPAWAPFALLLGLVVLLVYGAGQTALSAVPYVAVYSMFTFAIDVAWGISIVLALGTVVVEASVPGWSQDGEWLAVVLASAAVFGTRIAFERNAVLYETREEMAQLAVAEERSRFARDLHDILGHSLTVIAIKAELAGALVHVDPERAQREVRDLERLAREALADVRGAVSGLREISLAPELVAARAALAAAGIDSDLPTAVDDVPGELRELFAWAVREGVTNVVRHSGSSRCTVRITDRTLEVLDIGTGSAEVLPGNGITGLRERARRLGARVEHGPTGSGYRLAVLAPVVPA